MASEIYLNRYDKEMKTIPISELDWKDCETKIEDIKLIKDETGNLNRIECFVKTVDDWIPVFGIDSKGNGFMRQSGFFQYEESYEKAIEIAGKLKAIISGEDGFILFEPNIGILFDDLEPNEQLKITIDELAEQKVYFQKDVKSEIQKILKEKEDNLRNKTEYRIGKQILPNKTFNPPKSIIKKEKKWWEFWK